MIHLFQPKTNRASRWRHVNGEQQGIMTRYSRSSSLPMPAKFVSRLAALVVLAIAGLALVGWALNITLLPSYSRVGTRGGEFEPTESEAALDRALVSLQSAIAEVGAVVTHGPLPAVKADGRQLAQLFQNLVGDAVKFHGQEPPRIRVEAWREEEGWVFSVQDNGIGIDPAFKERIFLTFQRPRSRQQYPGTGIGLAICKRIVDRHRGRIWVASEPGKGSRFYFALPA